MTKTHKFNAVPLPEYDGKRGFAVLYRAISDEDDTLGFINGLTELTEEGYTVLNCGVNGSASDYILMWAILTAKIIEDTPKEAD